MRRSSALLVLVVLSLVAAGLAGAHSEAEALPDPGATSGMVSSGSGGYIPLTPTLVAELDQLGDERADIDMGGVTAIPGEGVGAVVLSLTAGAAEERSSVTVWPAGEPKPAVPNLEIDETRTWTTVAITRLGADRMLSVHNDRGHVDLDVYVLGWFPYDSELIPVGPERIHDTSTIQPTQKLRPDAVVDVTVAGQAGIPTEGVSAVVLNLTSSSSTTSSGITVWPQGDARPDAHQLVTEPARPRSNLAVIPVGQDGGISIHSQAGLTHLAIDVIGWIPADSAYRATPPTQLFETGADLDRRLDSGETVEIQVSGTAGVPEIGEDAELGSPHAAILNLTTYEPDEGTAITVYPTGDEQPGATSLAAGWHQKTTATLAVVELSEEGRISVHNAGTPAQLMVEVVGWFANPVIAAELLVPEGTEIPEPDAIESVQDGTVVLSPGAQPIETGDHIVVGVTEDTPEGYIGEVTTVETLPDGTQYLETTQAYLDDVFPEGDITVNLPEQDYGIGGITVTDLGGDRVAVTASATSPDGLTVSTTMEATGSADSCELSGVEAYLRPIFSFQLRVKWKWFSPKLTALATVGAEAGIALDQVSVACGWEFDLFKTTTTFWIGPVPVVLVFEGTIGVDVDAGLAGLDLGASAYAGVTVGVKANKFPYMVGFAGFDYTPLDEALLQARDLTAYAMVDLWLNIEVRLYGLVGPVVSIGPFLETTLTTNPSEPWWALDLGVAARISVKIDLWFKTFNFGAWEGEIPIADWLGITPCTRYGPGIGDDWEGVCRTAKPLTRPNGDTRKMASRFRLISSGQALAQLGIAPITLPDGSVGDPYPPQQLEATGLFSDTVGWHWAQGEVPGLTLDRDTGVLSGTPTTPGTYVLTIEAWYGPVPEGATTPPYGPFPPPEIVRTIEIEYVDTEPPIWTVPADISVVAAEGASTAPVDYTTTVSDDVGVTTSSCAPPSGSLFGLGTTTVTCTASDAAGNTAVATFSVTVEAAPGTHPLALGWLHSCAIVRGGSAIGTVACWGLNDNGQLGDGTNTSADTPQDVVGLGGVTAVAAGTLHTCALLSDRTVACWGDNSFGQLGDGTGVSANTPQPVFELDDVVGLTAGNWHTCALKADQTVSCWGQNDPYGQLGDGTTDDSALPVDVVGLTGVTQIAGGGWHTCARLGDGSARCWGLNEDGQLGDGTNITSTSGSTPQAVTGLTDATQITAGSAHTCAIREDHSAVCWGENGNGQLGDGSNVDAWTTQAVVGLGAVTAIDAGFDHTCAIRFDGTAACWGHNADGELGNGTNVSANTPQSVAGLTSVIAVDAGGSHTCSLRNSGGVIPSVESWGSNWWGELGIGTTGPGANTPQPVTLL